ncbi:MAG: DNA polymerase III subunit gamma/tau [Pirellula sp.]|nr:DNA polymerase III subunit gamma/tau [Pirellula sp.]
MADLIPSDDAAAPSAPAGEYVVVARRYRPQAFAELVGQQHVAQALSGAIHSHRVGHAYLFTGARGVGKTSTARIFAKALNCVTGPTDTPCNECDICKSVTAGDDVDVIEIDGASNRGIDDIRQLRQNVNVRPSRARFKIYIIDEVHMLSRDAFNALLKTLEEPPEHVKFIFCTTEPEKIPITILSRCQRFDFAGIETATIAERLRQITVAEGVEMQGEAIELLARRAAGSMRDGQSLLEQILAAGGKTVTVDDVQRLLGIAADTRLIALVDALTSRNAAAALAELGQGVDQGVDVGQLLDQLIGYLRDLLMAAVGCPSTSFLYVAPSRAAQVAQVGPQIGVQTLLATLEIAEQAAWRLKQTTHGRTVVEIALVRICSLDDLDDLATLVATIGSGTLPAGSAPAPVSVRATPSLSAAASASAVAPPAESQRPIAERASAPPGGSLAAEMAEAVKKNGTAARVAETARVTETPSAPTQVPAAARVEKPAAAVAPPSSSTPISASPTQAVHLSAGQAQAVWGSVLNDFHDLLADSARASEGVSFQAPNRFIVAFAKRKKFHKDVCERPDQAARLQQALSAAVGAPLKLEFTLVDDPVGTERATGPRGPSQQERHEKMREKAQLPFVRKALEIFDARPIRLEEDA